MKRDGLRALVFLCITIAVLWGLSYAEQTLVFYYFKNLKCEANSENRDLKVKLVMEHQIDFPVMIFGSSIALVHLDPDSIKSVTRMAAFNVGLNGNFFPENYGLINEYLGYCQNTKCIILCESFFSLNRHHALHRPDALLHYINNDNIYDCLYKIDPTRCFKERYVPFYKLTSVNFEYLKKGFGAWRDGNRDVPLNPDFSLCNYGFQMDSAVFDPLRDTSFFNSTVIDTNVLKVFRDITASIKVKGMKCFIIMPPIYYKGLETVTNIGEVREAYRSLQDGESIFFLDYSDNKELCLNKNNFFSNCHLNASAAAKFSGLVSHQIDLVLKH